MAKRLVVLSSSELILSFLIKGDSVYKISAEERGVRRYTNTIFKGKVKRLAKGMDGVFVDVGIGRDAFLPLKGESYRVGESLIVQMVREAEEEKGAKLTTNIKLVGKYLVYFPRGKDVKCSSKIQSEERNRLCSLLEKDLKEEGVILRSGAVKATYQQIKEELEKLRGLWQQIERRAKVLKKTQPILEEYPSYIRLIRDHWQDMEEIISDNPLIWNHIASFLEDFEPELLKKNLYIKDPTAYMHKYKLQESLRSVLNKVVWLKGGGYISIEETEAFTIIDVNSGDPIGSCHEENALRTNLEAVKEIAKQIMLRDIGGIILIDFIDMKKQENKDLVIKSMQQALEEEACNINIYGFTKLGILEMSRKKAGRSVSKLLTEACPYCSGKGYIKSSPFFLFELEKEIGDHAHKTLKVQVHPIRYEKVKKTLQLRGYSNVQVEESHYVGVNSFNISHE
ncbi:MAG: ribonuclease E/G [Aquificaceae bacterium]